LSEIDLVAVATSDPVSAQAAGERFGARAYSDARKLIEDDDVEAVTVAVKVPAHLELVEAALLKGQHVYREWPLTPDVATATRLRDLAQANSLVTTIGLQVRRFPVVRFATRMIQSGEIGQVLSAVVTCTHPMGGATVPAAHTYLTEDRAGANVLTISAGHAIDTLTALVGDVSELVATVSTFFPHPRVVETSEVLDASSPDHIVVAGTLAGGGLMSASFLGGSLIDPRVIIEVRGAAGRVTVTARPGLSAGNLEVEVLDAQGGPQEVRVEARPEVDALPTGASRLVGGLYLELRRRFGAAAPWRRISPMRYASNSCSRTSARRRGRGCG